MIPPVEKRVLNYALNKTPINTWNWVRWSEPGCSGSGRKYCRSCSSQSRGAAKRWLTTGGPVQENKLYAAFFFLRALFRLTRSEGEGLKHVKKKEDKKRLGLYTLSPSLLSFAVKQDETGQQQSHICFLSHFDKFVRSASLPHPGVWHPIPGGPKPVTTNTPGQWIQSSGRFPSFSVTKL